MDHEIPQAGFFNDVKIIKGHISRDHVHIFVSMPPHISVSHLVQSIKGKTSRKMMTEFKSLSRTFWGRHMWARGYFVASSGNVTDEVIMKYIEQQNMLTNSAGTSRYYLAGGNAI